MMFIVFMYKGKFYFKMKLLIYKIHIQDIYDLLDTLIIQYPKLSTISLSLPGIVDAGKVTSTYISGVENENIEEKLKQRYKQSIKLYNDINTAAVGYYATHLENKNLFSYFKQFL